MRRARCSKWPSRQSAQARSSWRSTTTTLLQWLLPLLCMMSSGGHRKARAARRAEAAAAGRARPPPPLSCCLCAPPTDRSARLLRPGATHDGATQVPGCMRATTMTSSTMSYRCRSMLVQRGRAAAKPIQLPCCPRTRAACETARRAMPLPARRQCLTLHAHDILDIIEHTKRPRTFGLRGSQARCKSTKGDRHSNPKQRVLAKMKRSRSRLLHLSEKGCALVNVPKFSDCKINPPVRVVCGSGLFRRVRACAAAGDERETAPRGATVRPPFRQGRQQTRASKQSTQSL